MPSLIRLSMAAVIIVAGVGVGSAPTAVAAGDCHLETTRNGQVWVCEAKDKGHDQPPGKDPRHKNKDVDSTKCQRPNARVIPCRIGDLVWFPYLNCYARQLHPKKTDPIWHGHDRGSIWGCFADTFGVRMVPPLVTWVPPSKKPAEPIPDPVALAQEAVGQIPVPRAKIHTAPSLGTPTYVHLKTWLFLPKDQWHPRSLTVSVRDTSVTGTITPLRVVWAMGPGSVTCHGPGRAWRAWMGSDAQTPCGFTYAHPSYDEPGGRYPISATIVWQATWTCSGVCLDDAGSLGEFDGPPGEASMRVSEKYSVVVR